jgi:uncharacterized membrane protein
MKMPQLRLLVRGFTAVCAIHLTALTALANPIYVITDLGVLPGATDSNALNLNDRGEVVGACSPIGANANMIAYVWRGGTMKSLGMLDGGNYSQATAINNSGVVTGDGDTGNFRPQSWVTSTKGLLNIFPNNGGNTHTVAINSTGAICGYYTKSLSGNVSSWRGAIWTPDPKDSRKYRTATLPVIFGPDPTFKGTCALPMAGNDAGQAAGYATNEVIGQHACFWNNDAAHSIVDLGTLPGDWSSIAWGMNGFGQVVGESHPPFGSRPTVWDADAAHTASELPLLPGDNYGLANAINNLGHVLGWSAASEPGTWNVGPARLVVWRDGGVFDLETLIEPSSAAGWTLSSAAAVNNVGQIVGSGMHNGRGRAYLLTPVP